MGKSKGAHHRGTYHVDSRRVRAAANANPGTTCWRCGRTLAEHPPHRNGAPAHWTAGHIIDGDPTSPLAPEVSTCNYTAGAVTGNQRRATGYTWP